MTDERAIDARELVERVHEESRAARWLPLLPTDLPATRAPAREDESLYYLHAHWSLPDSFDTSAAGGGIKGRILTLFGKITFRVLGKYLKDEHELLARVVRANEALALRCDELTKAFWERQLAEAENDAKLAAWLHEAIRDCAGSVEPQDDPPAT